ncbi:MAG: nicotinate-nucleotide--dimethylbenzimidazole phosphoribosyltransferase [Comamonadaceae bacterium]|nr:MAG: nicotinate-nucleotide--dimethylbenzimidazole phosphoribosyltransferase [Comamonadaceae bacterium]
MNLPDVKPVDLSAAPALRALIDGKAKPPGALGRIEDLALQLALIHGHERPTAQRALLAVFAGDHGLTEDGVSRYPAAVTVAMVATLLAGKASANAFAAAVGAEVRIIDAGVNADLAAHPLLVDAKVRKGSRNAAREPALTAGEVGLALSRGATIAASAMGEGFDMLVLGEMGIGNTASSALLASRLAPAQLESCVGRGTGHDDAGLAHKLAVLQRAAGRSAATAPLQVLAEFGGLEIAMMAGAVLGAAAARRPVLVDGFICSAAALAAVRLVPAARDYCIFTHRSAEPGHAVILNALGAEPLLDLGLRLGEGTGALLAVPMVRAAANLLTGVASLEDVLAGRL